MQIVNTYIIPIIRQDFVGRCLETLWKYTPPNFRVIIIDQSGNEEAYKKYKHLTHLWIFSYRNLGFAKAVNTGIKLAQTEYVTALNDDVEFINEKWWQGIIDTFAMDEKIIAVSPMSPKEGSWGYGLLQTNMDTWKPANPRFVWQGDDKTSIYPTREDGTGFFYKEEFNEDDWDFLINRNPTWVKGSVCDGIPMWCPVFKREKLFEVGIFDERFYPGGGEDYSMLICAYSCGWPVERDICDPQYHYRMVGTSLSWAWHHWGQSKDEISAKDPTNKLFESRSRWNNLDEIWGKDSDVWGHRHRTGENGEDIKVPIKRLSPIFEDEL
jgi:glycosyltransferase involved in cell wall biosynthesis